MTKIIKAKDHADNFADVYVLAGIGVGGNEYCKITFCRHIIETTSIPDNENPMPAQNIYIEAIQSVTLPMSMAKGLAKAILEAPTIDPDLVTPMQMKL